MVLVCIYVYLYNNAGITATKRLMEAAAKQLIKTVKRAGTTFHTPFISRIHCVRLFTAHARVSLVHLFDHSLPTTQGYVPKLPFPFTVALIPFEPFIHRDVQRLFTQKSAVELSELNRPAVWARILSPPQLCIGLASALRTSLGTQTQTLWRARLKDRWGSS